MPEPTLMISEFVGTPHGARNDHRERQRFQHEASTHYHGLPPPDRPRDQGSLREPNTE